jgi:hypothetical protein
MPPRRRLMNLGVRKYRKPYFLQLKTQQWCPLETFIIVAAMVGIRFVPLKLTLELNHHCEVLREQIFNLTMVFKNGVFGKWSELDKVNRVEPPWLTISGFIRRGRKIRGDAHACCLSQAMWCLESPENSANKKVLTRYIPSTLDKNCESK